MPGSQKLARNDKLKKKEPKVHQCEPDMDCIMLVVSCHCMHA